MTVASAKTAGQLYVVEIPEPDDFAFWRDRAREMVLAGVSPEQIDWLVAGEFASLFSSGEGSAMPEGKGSGVVRASKRFQSLAQTAAVHSDPERFALLYAMLWRLQGKARLMEDKADPLVRRLEDMDKAVRRDAHKMHAFVRFRKVENETGEDHYVAWFEPDHHILRREAGFFVRRFANMNWSILTPRGCLHWDTEVLRESGPARKSDAPGGDPAEDLWRGYYASIFNPARLKIGAMLKEMPRKYWKNMPEAQLIPELIAGAQKRESHMVDAGAIQADDRPDTLAAIEKAISACARCTIGSLENRAVMGEGPMSATLMIVGEQPGDMEDRSGKPFVGPAGEVLDAGLKTAGIARETAYVTNAVKHFKFTQRGKRRIHQSPTAKEIDTCRWWHEAERAIVQPRIVLALGASAARAMLGKTVSMSKVRGQPMTLDDGSELWVTAHPSYLLRLDGEAKVEQQGLFARDLKAVKDRLDVLSCQA